jgi:SOS-response transcriptional repressor LexA
MDKSPDSAASAGASLFEELMRFLPDGMTANAWAVRAGISRTIWSDLRRHGNPSRRTLSKLLEAVGSSLAEFEALRVGEHPRPGEVGGGLADGKRGWRAAPLAPIPLLATSMAGEWGEAGSGIDLQSIDRSSVVGHLDRPAALATDLEAYGVTIVGESMWPRFRAGRQLLVSPAASVVAGDDVLVQLTGGTMLIKELVHQAESSVELRQFKPEVAFRVESAGIAAIHRVMGEAI